MMTQTEPMRAGEDSGTSLTAPLETLNFLAKDTPVAKLVAQVFASAPEAERSLMLEHLLKPLGMLSLVAVANGIFADMLFRSESQVLHIRHEDALNVHVEDVIALVNHVLQVRAESVESLVHLFMTCSVMAGSGALR